MEKILYCEITGICIAILLIILYNENKRSRGPILISQNIFRILMWITVGFGIIQTIYKGIDESSNFLMASITLSLYYIFQTMIYCIFLLYMDYEVFPDNRRFKKRLPYYCLPAIIICVVVFINQWNGCIFRIEGSDYLRGPLFYVPRIMNGIYILGMFYVIFKYKEQQDKSVKKFSYKRLYVFPSVPCISIILQILMPVSVWILPITTIAILINYIAVQNSYMARDHLTGLYNRSQLEVFLNYQLKNLKKGNFFFLIMFDLDKFKMINDTYGHVVGDDALIHAANLLRESCKRKSDYVVRLGGDEFVIIGQCESKEAVKEIINRIHAVTEEYNRVSKKPYQIRFSAGYVIYDGSEETTLDKLISKADAKMYEDKKTKKAKEKRN